MSAAARAGIAGGSKGALGQLEKEQEALKHEFARGTNAGCLQALASLPAIKTPTRQVRGQNLGRHAWPLL